MKKKKVIISIIMILMISLSISLFTELFIFNRQAFLNKTYSEKLKIIDDKGFQKEKDYYISTKKDSYLVLQGNKKYINKISFDYQSKNDFTWDYEVSNSFMEKTKKNKVSRVIHTTTRVVDVKKVEKIIIKIHRKGIKIKNITATNKITMNKSRILWILISIFSLIIILKYYSYFKNKIEKTFLLLGLLFGTLFILLTPVCLVTGNDDQVHFHRMYTLLDGKSSEWTYSGRYFNHIVIGNYKKYKSYEEINLYKKFLNENNNKKSITKEENIDSNIDYQDLIYLPFSIGYKIGKIIGLNFVDCIYLSKFCNLLLYLLIMYYAIKIIPVAKRLLLFIGLLPSSLYIASQFSYDATITAGMMISFAAFLMMRKNEKVDLKYLMIFVLGIVWASLPKIIYCPMLLLLLFLNQKYFDNKKQERMVKVGIILLVMILMSTYVLPVLTKTAVGDDRVPNTSVTEQFKYIIHAPVGYIKLLTNETIYNFDKMFFGIDTFSSLGYLNKKTEYFNLSNFIILVTILYLTFTNKVDKKIMDKKFKIIMSILLVTIWCLIWTALYLSWTPVASPRISGVQSRYFIPLLLPLLMILIPNGKKIEEKKNFYYLYISPIVILSYSLLFILIRLYK